MVTAGSHNLRVVVASESRKNQIPLEVTVSLVEATRQREILDLIAFIRRQIDVVRVELLGSMVLGHLVGVANPIAILKLLDALRCLE